MEYLENKTRKKATKQKGVYKCERRMTTQVCRRQYMNVFVVVLSTKGLCPLQVSVDSRRSEALDPQQLAADGQQGRRGELSRTRAQSSESACCSSPSNGSLVCSELLLVKVALGRSIRELAATNHQLSCALATEEQQNHEGTINELVSRVEQLLASQKGFLHELCKLD